jgi:steroid delta-isomerase-like uncharacterized protein
MSSPNTRASTAPAESVDLVEAYVEMWNTRDLSAIEELVTDWFVMYDPAAPEKGVAGPKGEVHGREGLQQFLEGVTTGYPDFEVEVLDLLVDEAGAMYEVRLTGTHEGTLNGLPPTGRRMDVRGVSKLAFEDGRVTEHRVYFDTREVMEQLGMTFPTVLFQLPRLLLGALRGGR